MNRPAGQSAFELDRLKELLMRPETERLECVETQVETLDAYIGRPDRLEAATAEILVEAFRRAEIDRHRELAGAIAPVVVAAIRSEIKNSKDMMVEALYPITGRLVTAAVANAFRDLVADLNERFERTLSTHYWRLRLRALATGRPVSELALAEAQRPIVRRLLLLERGSGRLLASWHMSGEADAQSELVSGLIAAITEFASSVYGARSGELRTLDMGDARVFLRGAPLYLIAAECEGALGREHERELDAAFLSLVSRLETQPDGAPQALTDMAASLFVEASPAKSPSKWPLLATLGVVVALSLWAGGGPALRSLHARRIHQAFSSAMAAHPELTPFPLHVVVDHGARKVAIVGVAPSHESVDALSSALAPTAAPYDMVEHTTLLTPPPSTENLQRDLESLGQRTEALRREVEALRHDGNEQAARLTALDGRGQTTQTQLRDLQAQTQAQMQALATRVETFKPTPRDIASTLFSRTAVFFAHDDQLLEPDVASQRLDQIAAALKDNNLSVRVVGFTDPTGPHTLNVTLAQRRSSMIAAQLTARGVEASRIFPVTRNFLTPSGVVGDMRDRRVTFELCFDDEKHP